METLKKYLNHFHEALTTGKSLAGGVGAFLTTAATTLGHVTGAPAAVVALTLALGTALTAFSVWEIPFKPFDDSDEFFEDNESFDDEEEDGE